MAELTREEKAKAAQRAYMRKYSQRPEVRGENGRPTLILGTAICRDDRDGKARG